VVWVEVGTATILAEYNTIQYNTMICNAHKVENRTSNLRRGNKRVQYNNRF